jgi:hypothetical protein
MLDRLLRSRAWIWLLGIALGGIVAMQVSLLGMNAGISKSVQSSTDLEHRNSMLEEQISGLSGGDRVRGAAADLGLVTPDAGAVDFLSVRPGVDASRGANRIVPPSDEARQNLANGGVSTTAVTPVVVPVTTTITDPVTSTETAPTTTETAPVTTETAPVAETTPVPVTPAATAVPETTTTTTAGATVAP